MNLKESNYYSEEKNWEYMSCSQYKQFTSCSAKAMAELMGDIPKEDTKAFLVGNYVHSAFESQESHERFIEEHKDEMYTKKGTLYKDFIIAEEMVQRLKKDRFFTEHFVGEKEVIVTGELFGTAWKGKIDCLNIEKGEFYDLKTTADIRQKIWSEERKVYVPFVESFGYYEQMVIYKTLLEMKYDKEFTPYIFAVSKQSPCDIEAIEFRPEILQVALGNVEKNLPQILRIKNGEERPWMCGKCDYCRGHKQLTGFVQAEELIGG